MHSAVNVWPAIGTGGPPVPTPPRPNGGGVVQLGSDFWSCGANLASVDIPPSCPQWSHEGCCKTQAVLQTVSRQNSSFGRSSLHCRGCPEETEIHQKPVRLKITRLCVFFPFPFNPSHLQSRPEGLQGLEHRHGHGSLVHLHPQVPVIKAGVVLDRPIVL